MAKLLEGRSTLITGASSGIGRATAIACAREGAKVTIGDVQVEAGQATAEMVKEAGGEAHFVKCDVSKTAEVDAMVEAAVKKFGRLDCAFNNAGYEGQTMHIAEATEEDWDKVMAIDLKGVFLCLRAEIRQMLKQGGPGAIVNTASIAGLVGSHGMPAYTAAKHGVVGLTKVAGLEYSKRGIRVNAVCPGVIDTPMVERLVGGRPKVDARLLAVEPIGRKGKPQEIAEAVVWLLSDYASFVAGFPMAVDGGIIAQ
jgi:NAD(P)-dependent dehydrogenase (short-subunit alcohol dehydrogenase family)